MTELQQTRNFEGYSLFDDIPDKKLQAYNRAQVLFNIFQDNSDKKGSLTARASAKMKDYFALVPVHDRAIVYTRLGKVLTKNGYEVRINHG